MLEKYYNIGVTTLSYCIKPSLINCRNKTFIYPGLSDLYNILFFTKFTLNQNMLSTNLNRVRVFSWLKKRGLEQCSIRNSQDTGHTCFFILIRQVK
jgi:hypothetical protein